nr:hypothetical protein Ade03nite_23320 [Actinoplanes derwentensis]
MQSGVVHRVVGESLGGRGDQQAGENEGEDDGGTTHGILQRNHRVAASNQNNTIRVPHVYSFALSIITQRC